MVKFELTIDLHLWCKEKKIFLEIHSWTPTSSYVKCDNRWKQFPPSFLFLCIFPCMAKRCLNNKFSIVFTRIVLIYIFIIQIHESYHPNRYPHGSIAFLFRCGSWKYPTKDRFLFMQYFWFWIGQTDTWPMIKYITMYFYKFCFSISK